jgi:hypothetical protein
MGDDKTVGYGGGRILTEINWSDEWSLRVSREIPKPIGFPKYNGQTEGESKREQTVFQFEAVGRSCAMTYDPVGGPILSSKVTPKGTD